MKTKLIVCLALLLVVCSISWAMPPAKGVQTPPWVQEAIQSGRIDNPSKGLIHQLRRTEKGAKVSGKKEYPVLRGGFYSDKNLPDSVFTTTQAQWQSLLFDTTAGGLKKTVNSYYRDMSYNAMSCTGKVDVEFKIGKAANPGQKLYDYYGGGNNGMNNGTTGNAYEFIKSLLTAADPTFDFSKPEYDQNGDDTVDVLWVIHAGAGGEETYNPPNGLQPIWSHNGYLRGSWTGGSVFVTNDPSTYHPANFVVINQYTIQPEKSMSVDGSGVWKQAGCGVYCHEFGHALGLPDLYDTGPTKPVDSTGFGAGIWTSMAIGSWGANYNSNNRPTSLDVWSRRYLGWLNPVNVTVNDTATVRSTLNNSSRSAYKLARQGDANEMEYWLVENRDSSAQGSYSNVRWDSLSPGRGLLIWHIDSFYANEIDIYYNDVNNLAAGDGKYWRPLGVQVEETDTLRNYLGWFSPIAAGAEIGDKQDLWSNITRPTSKAFQYKQLSTTDSTHISDFNDEWTLSGVAVHQLPAPSSAMTCSMLVTQSGGTSLTPMSGDYTVGLTKFNQIIGKDLTLEKRTRLLRKKVALTENGYYQVPGAKGIVLSKEDFLRYDGISHVSYENYQWAYRDVEETYYELMDQDKPYNGPSFIPSKDGSTKGVYASITAAVNDINLRGLSGPVRFLLNDANYTSESFPILINILSSYKPTSTNTFTIKPNTGVNATIRATLPGDATFRIFNTEHVIFDGSNTAGGTTQNLTIKNDSITYPIVFWIDSRNDSIKNCIMQTGNNLSDIGAVFISDFFNPFYPSHFSNLYFRNNSFKKAGYGIFAVGGDYYGQYGTNLNILGNQLNTSTAGSQIGAVGIYCEGVNRAVIRGNDIGYFDATEAVQDQGITFTLGTKNSIIDGNRIHDLSTFYGGGYGAWGIYMATSLADAKDTICNNFIYNLTGDGFDFCDPTYGPFWNPIAICARGTQGGLHIYSNSINLYGTSLEEPTGLQALSAGIMLGSKSSANIKNNCIVNTLSSATGASYACGIFVDTTTAIAPTRLTTLDNNLYDIDTINTQWGGIGIFGSASLATTDTIGRLSKWQTRTGKDANAINRAPGYTADTDLHINPGTGYAIPPPGSHTGTLISGITTDYDGNTIFSLAPDIGADEFVVNRTLSSTATLPASIGYDTMTVSSTYTATINTGTTFWGLLTNVGALALGANTLTLRGSAINNGAITGTGKLKLYNGLTSHAISGSKYFQNLELDDASKGATLGANLSIGGTLTLTSGVLTTNSNTVLIDYDSSATLSRPTNGGWVNGNLAQYLEDIGETYSARKMYHVGTESEYSPDSITFYNGTSGGYITSTAVRDSAGYASAGTRANAGKRHWKFTKDGTVAFDTAKVTLWYNSVDFNTGFTEDTTGNKFVFASYNPAGKGSFFFYPRSVNYTADTATITGVPSSKFGQDIAFGRDPISLNGTLGVESMDDGIPVVFYMSNCRPNPSTGPMEFRFGLPKATKVSMEVFNLLGQRVRVLADAEMKAGHHTLRWDGRDEARRKVAAGAYIYRLVAGENSAINKVMIIR